MDLNTPIRINDIPIDVVACGMDRLVSLNQKLFFVLGWASLLSILIEKKVSNLESAVSEARTSIQSPTVPSASLRRSHDEEEPARGRATFRMYPKVKVLLN